MRPKPAKLFDTEPDWRQHWAGMPEFVQEAQMPYSQIIIRFETKEDLENFALIIGQTLTRKTKSIWHPFKSHWGNGSNYIWKKSSD